MNSSQWALMLLLVALLGPGSHCALAKRFDCELFCRTTGFHGNVGGCRCSFTLFTSKRNSPSSYISGRIPNEYSPSVAAASSLRSSQQQQQQQPQYSNIVANEPLDHYIRI